MIDDNDPKFVKFCAWRESMLKTIRKDLEQEEAVKTLVEFEEALQHYSDKHGLIITAVPIEGDGQHLCFTPKNVVSLRQVHFEFLEDGE